MCGVLGNLPFGMAPGAGLSVYLTYGLVMAGTMSRTQAMTTCLFSGRRSNYSSSGGRNSASGRGGAVNNPDGANCVSIGGEGGW